MYLALYRKFRPKSFNKIIGQNHIVQTLKNQIKTNQISHAYLFCGSRGTGKTTAAKVFANAINCLSPVDGSACGKCEVCKHLNETQNIDIIEIDAASNNRVDEIRDLREKIKYPPVYGKYKVYIIDEVHMLTDSAFNALLKTLEEPPAHALFILATTEPHKLPATILSRVLRFDFKLVGQDELVTLLKDIFAQSGIVAEDEAINLIAKAGEGSVRDCLSIADMCASYCNNNIKYNEVLDVLGSSDRDTLYRLASAIYNNDIANFIKILNEQSNSGKNIITLSTDLTKYFRDLLVLKACNNTALVELPNQEQNKMLELSKKFLEEDLNNCLQSFSSIESELKYANNPVLLIEATAIGLICNSKKKLTKPIEQSVAKVENVILNKDIEKINNPSPRHIWGKVLVQMRKDNLVTLRALSSDITNVNLLDNSFIIKVNSKTDLEMLTNVSNYNELVACFNKLGYTYNVKIELIEEEKTLSKTNKIELLEEILGVKVENIK